MSIGRRSALLLNASLEPLRIISLKKALTLLTKGVAVVELSTDVVVHRGLGIYAPSVIRLRNYRHVPIRMQVVSRKNIFLRDSYRCQYCGRRFQPADLTLDHIVPRSRGGDNSWSNLVACCRQDNVKKGDRLPEECGMTLVRRPLPQNIHTPRFLLKTLGAEVNEWKTYLWHDSDGDRRFAFN